MKTSKTYQAKSLPIETLRGIAIILVVMGHVIGSGPTGGMQVDDDSFYRYLYCLLENIRMPLFTVISGWVYALHPIKKEEIGTFITKKARRLLLPMIFVGSTYFIIQYLIPGTNHKEELHAIWKIYIYPYTFFWYLPALFFVFIGISFLDISNKINTVAQWLIALLISYLLCITEISHIIPASVPNLFAFKNALYLMPFFILGVGLNRFKQKLYTKPMIRLYLIGTIIGVILQQTDYFTGVDFYNQLHLSILIGIISTAFILHSNIKIPFFIWLAKYAYTIYLFHGFGTSGGRIILKSVHIHNEFIIFLFATIIAVLSSVIIEKILIKVKLTRTLFLGKK
ncbi:acyltransferase [uncultured Bacteroides sp.]|uniref:acyltransferase family protein n=1 Tax=uncultured Bacteroides sp. TaxID=162156 RepID=UPI00260687D5|nr:acyltransferase [uncultured Bacteroides sp.]